jgi:hypothetical protein
MKLDKRNEEFLIDIGELALDVYNASIHLVWDLLKGLVGHFNFSAAP